MSLETNLEWYKQISPKNYAKLDAICTELSIQDSQWPEAACYFASIIMYKIIPNLNIMAGKYGKANHMWVYDLAHKCYIDITLSQFRQDVPPIVILKYDQLHLFPYRLTTIEEWNELFVKDHPLFDFSDNFEYLPSYKIKDMMRIIYRKLYKGGTKKKIIRSTHYN